MIPIPAKPKPIRLLPGLAHISPLKRKAATVSAGGIHIPPGADDDQKQWLVLGLGPGRIVRPKKKPAFQLPLEVAIGDRVMVDIGIGGVELPDGTWIVRQSHIMMKW